MTKLTSVLLGAAFVCISQIAAATPEKLTADLHAMRLAAASMVTNFYMFSGLEADAKYSRQIDKALKRYTAARESAEAQADEGGIAPAMADIRGEWQRFFELLEGNRSDILRQGYPEIRLVDDMGKEGTQLVTSLSAAYETVQLNTGHQVVPAVAKARQLAYIMAEMTALYTAEGTSNLGYLFVGTGENTDTLGELADSFNRHLSALEGMTLAPAAKGQLRNVVSKWRFVEERIRNHNENSVPFLVVSYSARILEHLEKLEDSYH